MLPIQTCILQFDGNVVERALEDVNVMILTRLIREQYPHKFA